MMRLSRWAVVTGALLSLSAAATFTGCGSSNGTGTNGNEDGGDATSDQENGDSTTDVNSSSSSGSSSGGADTGAKDTGAKDTGAKDTGTGDTGTTGDGGTGSDASNVPDGFFGGDGSMCITLGSGCTNNSECCTGYCSGNICARPPCTSVGGTCATGSECCSFTCGAGGTCENIGGNTCLPLGNSCGGADGGTCCSGNCAMGTCQPASFCGQTGDICQSGANCCSGVCNVPTGGSVGTCNGYGGGGNCSGADGQLCTPASFADGGCGGNCCSRACGPWGPTGIYVCQPATGCHVEGDTCTTDSECCGSAALADAGIPTSGNPVTCVNGYCQQHMGCTPNGDVCKLMTTSCNANQDCCAGLGNSKTACRQDNLGVPRCASPNCVDGGAACATSADCCNGNPCVPNVDGGSPPYTCYPSACVPSCGSCSTSADCCPGYSCINGTCDPCGGGPTPDGGITDSGSPDGPIPDGGVPDSGFQEAGSCAQYGQLCGGDGGLPCCTGLACLSGRCQLN